MPRATNFSVESGCGFWEEPMGSNPNVRSHFEFQNCNLEDGKRYVGVFYVAPSGALADNWKG